MNKKFLNAACLAMIIPFTGCSIGYNKVLFMTRTNVGVDFDVTPPAAEIAISRTEAVIAPTFEGGQTLPVMASFTQGQNSIFRTAVSQTFATGNAAVVVSEEYLDDDLTFARWNAANTNHGRYDSSLHLSQEPGLPEGQEFIQTGTMVCPVFFGTTTSFGLRTTWSSTSSIPTSIHLGYKRKELALAPIAMADDSSTRDVNDRDITMPSLLATIDVGTNTGGTVGNANLGWVQYFATGSSATSLARRQSVRLALAARFDPNQAQRIQETIRAQELLTGGTTSQIAQDSLEIRAGNGDANAKAIVDAQNAIATEALSGLGNAPGPFNRFGAGDDGDKLEEGSAVAAGGTSTGELRGAVSQLEISISHLDAFLSKPSFQYIPNGGTEVTVANGDTNFMRLQQSLIAQQAKYHELNSTLNRADQLLSLYQPPTP